jgi:CheY-like chemotaxis protein
MLSHELRNPLGAVLNAAQLLNHVENADPKAGLAAEVIVRQSGQMARLLDDLLDVSRVTQGKIDIRRETIDLGKVVQDAVEAVRPELEERRHDIELNLPQEPLCVEGDPARILQIQENLLNNAAKYTPPDGRIKVDVLREGDEAVVSVSDNGQGIPPDMLSAIFELFVQGPKSLARTEGGMGIGLSLARVLVELHGGSLSVESAGKGQGSAFTMRLPVTAKKPNAAPSIIIPQAAGMRVLIVEDNDDSRMTLEKLLRLYGCEVMTAADGHAGFECISRMRPDVAVVDIGLPQMDGYEVARRVRNERWGDRVKLIALTGYGRAEDRLAVMQAGFNAHLVKPVNPAELVRVMTQAKAAQ